MLRIYRLLLRLYPSAFREEYAKGMEQEFRAELAETRNKLAVVWICMRLLFDMAMSLPSQLAEEIGHDCRHALRLWAKRPWQTGFAVIALAVAIGANTGVFSVVNALLLRSLPFENSDRLAVLLHFIAPHDSVQQFNSWRRHTNYLEDAALFEDGDFNIGDPEHMSHAHIAMASSNFFSLLGSHAIIGRTFAEGDHAVAVISYGMWQDFYAGSDQVLGKTIRVHGLQPNPDEPLTIIGVMPAGFEFPAKASFWKMAEYTAGNNGWRTIGRLKSGLTWTQARAAFLSDLHRLEPHRRFRADWIPMMMSLQDELAGYVKNASLLLSGLVVLVLLIACANLANIMLARTTDRQQELSIRSAIGASRARLMQQVFTECLLLAVISAAIGIAVAFSATSLASKVAEAPLPSQQYGLLDGRVLAFMLGLSIVSALGVGLWPAMIVGRTHAFAARGSAEFRRSRMVRELLVTAQVMLTIVLLTASLSVMRALSHQLLLDRGFHADGLVTASVALDGTVRNKSGQRLQYFEEVLDRLRQLPEVRAASATEFSPLLSQQFMGGPYKFDGHQPEHGGTDVIPVMADYFATTGGHLLYGREFTDADVRSDAKFVIVNETFAKLWLRPADAVGHLVIGPDRTERRIIGVVRNLDFMGQYISNVFDIDPPETFIPSHNPGGFDSTFAVKVAGNPEGQVAAIRATIQAVDRGVPVYEVETMRHRLNRAFARPKFYRTVLVFFAAFALLLSVIGIYAVVSYAVMQRLHEMGVRLALGTTPMRLRSTFVRDGLATVLLGTLGGIVCGVRAGKLLGSLIEGAKGSDFQTYTLAAISICLVTTASIWLATRRIARMDVAEILRAE